MQQNLYSVSKLNQEIKEMLEGNPLFRNIFVQGEISNYKAHSSGHHYLTLKDDGAAISAVMFRTDASRLRFRMENGMKVIARGRVSSFPRSGQVQLYISDMMPDGLGAMHIAFEQLKAKLHQEGLFAEARKKKLPRLPQKIALITSPTGAAVRDMLRILGRRWPAADVQLFPVLVQGPDAPADLRRALELANALGEADLIIIGRGGGSAEDLWAFNDEALVRAIAASEIPVVSAVGHEPDITLSDFAADLRAPTPSGAAELVTPDISELYAFLKQADAELQKVFYASLSQKRERVRNLSERLALRTPKHIVEDKRMQLAFLEQKMLQHINEMLHKNGARVARNAAALDALSPLKVLVRGYAVAAGPNGKAVTDSRELKEGDKLHVRFAQGSAECRVIETRNEHAEETII